MCIVSPKLVECSRHSNVELLTYSDVEQVQGDAGTFKIRLKKKARSVDPDKCTGCRECMNACPVQNRIQIPETFEQELTEEVVETDTIIDKYNARRQALIMILQDVNSRFNYLPEAALRRISSRLDLSYAEIYGTASFYKAFSLEPRGKHIIQVCMGTACHVRGAQRILEEFERLLGIENGQTTDDRLFTLGTVNCLGACALGPIVTIDEEYHGNLTPSSVAKLVDLYAKK
jgi:NADH-quinone oxidoreductase subunit E